MAILGRRGVSQTIHRKLNKQLGHSFSDGLFRPAKPYGTISRTPLTLTSSDDSCKLSPSTLYQVT